MRILLVAATALEIAPLLDGLKRKTSEDTLLRCPLGKHKLDILITGIGMAATAFQMGIHLDKKYDLAINAGIAGSFNRNIPLGTMVNIIEDCFADLGAEDGKEFLTLAEMGLIKSVKVSPLRIRNLPPSIGKIKRVKGITVNTVHGNTGSIRRLVKKFNPDVESMEGAAFFHACNYFKIPSMQLRTISNYVEKRKKKTQWAVDLAVSNLNQYLAGFLLQL